MLEKYFSFVNEEFTKKDKDFIKEMSEYFTISVEYELAANLDIEDEPYLKNEEEIKQALGFVKEQTLLDMSRGKIGYRFDDNFKLPRKKLEENEEKMKSENDLKNISKKELKKLHQKYVTWTWVNYFIDWLLVKIDVDDEERTDRRINKPWDTDIDDYIATLILKNSSVFIHAQNMGFLKKKLEEHLPKFYKKYSDAFKFELESANPTLRVLEFSSKGYLNGINKCFEQIDDFYEEFERQNFWIMTNLDTGLHVNVGVQDRKLKWNPLKGLIIMSDMNRDKKTPFVFTDIMWRITNRFTNSLLDAIRRNLTGEIKKDYETKNKERRWNLSFRHKERLATHKDYLKKNIEKLDVHNIEECENFFNPYLIKANKDFYIKEFGIKLVELEYDPGYVEFRYVGGEVGRNLLKDKVLYFCYIVYLMTNDEYKKKEYQKRLYKYMEDIKDVISNDEEIEEGVKWFKDGKLVKDPNIKDDVEEDDDFITDPCRDFIF